MNMNIRFNKADGKTLHVCQNVDSVKVIVIKNRVDRAPQHKNRQGTQALRVSRHVCRPFLGINTLFCIDGVANDNAHNNFLCVS